MPLCPGLLIFLHFPCDDFGVTFCRPKKILFTGCECFFNMICCLEYEQNWENRFNSAPLLHECRSFSSRWPPYWEIVFLPCFSSVSRSHVLPRVFLLLFFFIISITILLCCLSYFQCVIFCLSFNVVLYYTITMLFAGCNNYY